MSKRIGKWYKSEKVPSNSSFYDLNNTGVKTHRPTDNAFITSVPGLAYFNRVGSQMYDINKPIDEREEQRDLINEEIVTTYNKLQDVIHKLEDRINGVIEVNEQDMR